MKRRADGQTMSANPLHEAELVIIARLTRILAWTGIVIGIVAVPAVLLIAPSAPGRLVVALTACLVGVIGLRMLRRGSRRMAAGVVLWGLWATMACGGVFNGGVSAPGMSASIVLASFAALTLGLQHGLALCGATGVLCAGLVLYEQAGHAWLPVPPVFRALIFVVLGTMSVVMLWSTATLLRESVLAAHREAERRADAERQVRRSQEDLQAANAQLETRIQERTAQLSIANRELESFSYSVAHDLRAPLRTIDGFSAELEANLAQAMDGQTIRDLARIRAASRRMSEQIEGLLRLSRLGRAHLHRTPTDLSALATAVIDSLRHQAPDRTVAVEIAPEVFCDADPALVHDLLENLLGNAWKYTAKTPDARIGFGMTQGDGERLFFVRDNGAGFDMAYAQHLFAPFQRLHSAHEFEGTGIGLATVQRIVHRHGGRIWAEAAVGKGATFHFTLPPGTPGV